MEPTEFDVAIFDVTFFLGVGPNLDLQDILEIPNPVDDAARIRGFDFWQEAGFAEGRLFSPLRDSVGPVFDEVFYVAQDPSIQADIDTGVVGSALEHYITIGSALDTPNGSGGAQFNPNEFFDPAAYLAANPDIVNAVDFNGNSVDPFVHYLQFGENEIINLGTRSLDGLVGWDPIFYSTNNTDIAEFIDAGAGGNLGLTTYFQHFVESGRGEGREPVAPPSGLAEANPVTVNGQTHFELSGTYTEDLVLRSGEFYSLNGPVFIGADVGQDGTGGDAATITIEPGAIIYGQNPQSLLVVSRGSQIFAEGTQTNPIIFTSADDIGAADDFGRTQREIFTGDAVDDPNTSEWGGLVINGRAPLNVAGNEADGEGDSGLYGGDVSDDNSGVLRFIQVKYAGNPITGTDELNSIAFQGVGSGTTVEFVQIHNGADDGFEWFGGTVDARYIIVTGADDDSLDWTQGWQGDVQFALVVQNPLLPETDRGIEADNLEENNDATPRSAPTFSNVTLIGSGDLELGDTGAVLRRGTAGEYGNFVITNWEDAGIDLDDSATFEQAEAGALTIQSFLIDDTTNGDAIEVEAEDPFDSVEFINGQANNVVGPTSLQTATGTEIAFINGANEQAVTSSNLSAADPDFIDAGFVGAVNNNNPFDAANPWSSNWTDGWTFGLGSAGAPPTDPEVQRAEANPITVNGQTHFELSGTITEDITLRSGEFYALNGPVFIGADVGFDGTGGDPATITIEPGAIIYGQNPQSLLVVSRGSQILAEGTQTNPIIFTSADDIGAADDFGRAQREIFTGAANEDPNTSEWGGLVINGRAPLNVAGGEADGEGDSGQYGGDVADDNSGVLRFVQVKYAGNPITGTDELNSIALQGVGSGTTVEFVQIHNGADDGFEWFGGTVDARYIIVTGADDDALDWTQGWQGDVQFALVVQNPLLPETDRGIEADNLEENNDALPRSAPNFSNVTLIGSGDLEVGDTGAVLRRGTAGNYGNFVITNWEDAGIDLDDPATFEQADAGALTIQSFLLDNVTNGDAIEVEAEDPFDSVEFVNGQANNVVGPTSLRNTSGGSIAFVNGPNEGAVTSTDFSTIDSFFVDAGFVGAVNSSGSFNSAAPFLSDWTDGWTFGLGDLAIG